MSFTSFSAILVLYDVSEQDITKFSDKVHASHEKDIEYKQKSVQAKELYSTSNLFQGCKLSGMCLKSSTADSDWAVSWF